MAPSATPRKNKDKRKNENCLSVKYFKKENTIERRKNKTKKEKPNRKYDSPIIPKAIPKNKTISELFFTHL